MTESASAPASPRDGQAAFDFLFGTWTIRNRRLSQCLVGSTSWYEFAATATTRPIWGGAANVEEWDGTAPSGRIQGAALRLYNPATRQWSISWASRSQAAIDPPVVGSFHGGRGEFFARNTYQGRPIRERVIWTVIDRDACRWEQAFSADDGTTWETNWIMEFARIAPST